MSLTHEELMKLDRNKLCSLAAERGIKYNSKMKKEELIMLILEYELEHMTAARIPGINTEIIEANQPSEEEVEEEIKMLKTKAKTKTKSKPAKSKAASTKSKITTTLNKSAEKLSGTPGVLDTKSFNLDKSQVNQEAFNPQVPQVQTSVIKKRYVANPSQSAANLTTPPPQPPQVITPQPPQPQVQPPANKSAPVHTIQYFQPPQPTSQIHPNQVGTQPQSSGFSSQPQDRIKERQPATNVPKPINVVHTEYNVPQQHTPQSIDSSRAAYFEENTKVYVNKPNISATPTEYRQKGILDIHPDNTFGFLRQREFNLGDDDIYVSQSQIKKFNLLTGDLIEGYVRPPKDQERYPCLVRVESINGLPPEKARLGLPFEKFVPIYPNDRIVLETTQYETSTRLIDLFSPIGRGQRGIIVAKPKAGKTTLLKKIANAVAEFNNHCISVGKKPIHVIALLIDERPEEVTDFKRSITGEVISSTFDEKPENHIQVAELTLEYAKRKVENGEHVLILLDSLTRLARAYNLTCPSSGKTLTGGLDPNSLHKPKRFLGSARNLENGGSLTIICTALIETGSRLDDIIYEEFKGTANMEVHLDRAMADRRIFPAIDVIKSGTRHEELLYTKPEMEVIWRLRKITADLDESERLTRLITRLVNTKNNAELLLIIHKASQS